MPESRPFEPAFQATLPLPLARLYVRAHHAKGDRDRHDHAFHLLEATLKLVAAALVARYRSCGKRSTKVDTALRCLARPSLGHWRSIFLEILSFLSEGVPEDPWARGIHERLRQPREDLREAFACLAKAAQYKGRAVARPTALDLLDLLPTYRNAMSDAHGGVKADRQAYREPTPALLALAHDLLGDGGLLGRSRLVYAEEVQIGIRGEERVHWMDLLAMGAIRRQPLEGEVARSRVFPGRLYLEVLGEGPLTLYPLVHYQPGEVLDEVFFLNRAREGAGGIQFLSYTTGEFYLPRRDPLGDALLADLKELLSWVTQREITASGMDELAATSRAEAEASGEAAREDPQPTGTVLGDFEILGELGRGGMAVVYLARQMSLNRQVALKVLPPAFGGDPVALARFKQEVRALSRCDHPNVVKILSSGEALGTHYYAMEFIDGGDLAVIERTLERYRSSGVGVLNEEHFDRAASSASSRPEGVRTAGLPEAERLEPKPVGGLHEGRNIAFRLAAVIRDAARGVHHVHEHGIVHRDLKPQNIMVTRSEHRPVVMDLGLAKLSDVSRSLTLDKGSILGTLRYMPPEQLQRNLLEVDARADVYALGAMLYELACLRPMVDGDSEERLTTQILFEDPPPAQKVNPRIPTDLATIIAKATRKDPKERFAGAADLAEDLDRFINGEAISAKPPTLGYLLQLALKRHRRTAAAAALTLLLFAALLVGWIMSLRSERAEARRQLYVASLTAAEVRLLAHEIPEAKRRLVACPEEMRGWEWRHLALKADESIAVLRGHEKAVNALAFIRDGREILSGSYDGTVRIWDAGTGHVQTALRLKGHVTCLAVSKDCKRIVSGSSDKSASTWEIGSDRPIASLSHPGPVRSVAIDPSGNRVASTFGDHTSGSSWIWEASSGKHFATLQDPDCPIFDLAFCPDGTRIVTASKAITFWDATSGKALFSLGDSFGFSSLALSVDGRKVAGANSGSMISSVITVWDAETREVLQRLDGLQGSIWALAFNLDGSALAGAGLFGTAVQVWEVPSGKLVSTFHQNAKPTAIAFSPDGMRIVSGSGDGEVRLWDTIVDRASVALPFETVRHKAVAFSPDGHRIAAPAVDGHLVLLYDPDSLEVTAGLRGHELEVDCVAFSPDGSRIATASIDRTVRVWDSRSGELLGTLQGHGKPAQALAFSPDGSRIVSGGRGGEIRIWDATTNQELAVLPGEWGFVNSLSYEPQGNKFAAGYGDGTVRVWEARSERSSAVLRGHSSNVTSVAFSPDGTCIASASYDHSIRLWDVASGDLQRTLTGHSHQVNAVAFSRDGKRILSGSWDKTARLWDAATGDMLLVLRGNAMPVFGVAFSPDDARIATAADRVLLWETTRPPEAVLRRRSEVALRNRKVQSLLSSLFKDMFFSEEVIAQLEREAGLDEPTRGLAKKLALIRGDDPSRLNDESWRIVRTRGAGEEAYRHALRLAQAALRSRPESGPILNTLGAAQYRTGMFQESLASLARSDEINRRKDPLGLPADLAFIAMARHQFSQAEGAGEALALLRKAMQDPQNSRDQEALELLREAEELLKR